MYERESERKCVCESGERGKRVCVKESERHTKMHSVAIYICVCVCIREVCVYERGVCV